MNILISGIYGFIGSSLTTSLKNKHQIYGIDIISIHNDGVIKTYSWDELEELPSIDIIIHLAGKARDSKNKNEEKVYFEVNTGLTMKIFDYFLHSSAKQFIFFSSVKAVADSVIGEYLTEDVVPKPIGPYGVSKIKAEEYIQSKSWHEKKVYILRPCMVHGPNNKGNLNLLYNVVKKGFPWPLGAFDNKRSFLNIWNLEFIIEQLINKQPQSGVYNLADDEPISINELIKFISYSLGKKVIIWNVEKKLIHNFVKIGSLLKLPFRTERFNKLTDNYIVSNQKLKLALGIEHLPISVKDGIIKTLETFNFK